MRVDDVFTGVFTRGVFWFPFSFSPPLFTCVFTCVFTGVFTDPYTDIFPDGFFFRDDAGNGFCP